MGPSKPQGASSSAGAPAAMRSTSSTALAPFRAQARKGTLARPTSPQRGMSACAVRSLPPFLLLPGSSTPAASKTAGKRQPPPPGALSYPHYEGPASTYNLHAAARRERGPRRLGSHGRLRGEGQRGGQAAERGEQVAALAEGQARQRLRALGLHALELGRVEAEQLERRGRHLRRARMLSHMMPWFGTCPARARAFPGSPAGKPGTRGTRLCPAMLAVGLDPSARQRRCSFSARRPHLADPERRCGVMHWQARRPPPAFTILSVLQPHAVPV